MSAEVLREAAALMRERAKATEYVLSVDGTPVPWHGEGVLALDFDPDDAAHIAGMSPAVALAVADWLDATAHHIDKRWTSTGDAVGGSALAVARAYLRP